MLPNSVLLLRLRTSGLFFHSGIRLLLHDVRHIENRVSGTLHPAVVRQHHGFPIEVFTADLSEESVKYSLSIYIRQYYGGGALRYFY